MPRIVTQDRCRTCDRPWSHSAAQTSQRKSDLRGETRQWPSEWQFVRWEAGYWWSAWQQWPRHQYQAECLHELKRVKRRRLIGNGCILMSGLPKHAPIAIFGNPCFATVRLATASVDKNDARNREEEQRIRAHLRCCCPKQAQSDQECPDWCRARHQRSARSNVRGS